MKILQRNMKGFIFTLDAIFALIVAAVGVSILLYVDFTSAGAYGTAATQAAGTLHSMLQTTVSSVSGGSLYLNYLSSSANSSSSTWPQFGHDGALSSSTGYSVAAPYLLYTWNAPTVIQPIVSINSGFAAMAAGTKIYIINATTGKLKTTFPAGSPSNAIGEPAIYDNMFFYGNASKVVKGVNIYNSIVQWNFTAANSIATPIEIENNYVAFGTQNSVYLLNPLNGSSVGYINLAAPAQIPIYINGEYIVSTTWPSTQNYLYSYILTSGSNTPVNVWNVPLTTSLTTAPASANNTVAVGSGNYLFIVSPGGKLLYSSNDLESRIVGIGSYANRYYVETVNKLYSFSQTGNILFTLPTPSDGQNSTPSAGPGAVYTVVNGNSFIAYNTSYNKLLWNMSLPSNYLNTGYSQVSLAYGNIYVTSGNSLYVFGTYKPQPNDNILQTLGSMYLSGQGDYSNILLQNLYNVNASNSGIFINNTYAPTLGVATFNSASNSYIEQADGLGYMNNNKQHFSISIWVYPTSGNGVIVDELGQIAPKTKWHYSVLELVNGNVLASVPKLPCINLGTIPLNGWSNIVLTWNATNYKGYINGALENTGVGTSSVPGGSSLMYYPLGTAETVADSCGSGAYFTGSMLDYQLYNVTLSSQQASQVYQSGAFSAPINSAASIWMPLDGNSNEFSGNANQGFPYNIKYTKVAYTPLRLANSYQVSKASSILYLNNNGTMQKYNVSVVDWR